MFRIEKRKGVDFTVLNLSDPQISDINLYEQDRIYNVMVNTVKELVDREKPDLITVSGDISYGSGPMDTYVFFADFVDSFGIPWSVVWGNHDNQGGQDCNDSMEKIIKSRKNCIYERGDEKLGNGNYVIVIEEENVSVEAIIMMDTHNVMPYKDRSVWARLYPEQVQWYRETVAQLKEKGCKDTTLIMHIPIFEYRLALAAAVKDQEEYKKLGIADVENANIWNHGYESSFGVFHEEISSYPEDDGMMKAIIEGGSTKNIISGHDHVNNFSILHNGVRFTYALKTGPGCYWEAELNGGTVLKIGQSGVKSLYHSYVDSSKWL